MRNTEEEKLILLRYPAYSFLSYSGRVISQLSPSQLGSFTLNLKRALHCNLALLLKVPIFIEKFIIISTNLLK